MIQQSPLIPVAVVTCERELWEALRARAEVMDMPRDVIDDLAGVAPGYSAKLLADPPMKKIGPATLFRITGAMGLSVTLVEDPAALSRVHRSSKYRKRDGRAIRKGAHHWRTARLASMMQETLAEWRSRGGHARAAMLTKEQRQEIARIGSKARWRKWRKARREARAPTPPLPSTDGEA